MIPFLQESWFIHGCQISIPLRFYDFLLLIHRLSDAGGKMEFTEVASGKDINKSLFSSDDGMHSCFIRIAEFSISLIALNCF